MSGLFTHLLAAAETVGADGNAISQMLHRFGVDWPFFIAQVINFLIVGSLLYFFAVKPLSAKLQERRDKIEDGLRYTDEMKQKLDDAQKRRDEILKEATIQAQDVVRQAGEQGKAVLSQQSQQAAEQAEDILKKAREQADQQYEAMLKQVRQEAADLVVQTTAQLLKRDLASDERGRIADEAAKSISRK